MKICRAVLLASALATASVAFGSVRAADAPKTRAATSPQHSAKQVLSIATVKLHSGAENAARYKAKPPRYDADKKVWLVFFIQNAPPFIVDGDLLVVVDDLNGSACIEQAIAVGPCT